MAGQRGAFSIMLDGKPVHLAGHQPLLVPFGALAFAIAEEWQAVGIDGQAFTPDDLPLTRLALTASERVLAHRDEIIGQLCAYGMNDLLCYRAEDEAVAAHEHAAWQPLLDWAARVLEADLIVGAGITPIAQPAEAEAAFKTALNSMSDDQLAGLGVIVPALGSLVLGLAVVAGEIEPEHACATAQLDELFQEERWGQDEQAVIRRQTVVQDVAVSARFMVLCAP